MGQNVGFVGKYFIREFDITLILTDRYDVLSGQLFDLRQFMIRGTTMCGTVRIDSVTKLAKIAFSSITTPLHNA